MSHDVKYNYWNFYATQWGFLMSLSEMLEKAFANFFLCLTLSLSFHLSTVEIKSSLPISSFNRCSSNSIWTGSEKFTIWPQIIAWPFAKFGSWFVSSLSAYSEVSLTNLWFDWLKKSFRGDLKWETFEVFRQNMEIWYL